jgi:hypothetical protein
VVHNRVTTATMSVPSDSILARWNVVTEMWFDVRADAEMAIARIGSDEKREIYASFLQTIVHLLVDEQLLHESGERPLLTKVLVFFKRRFDMTREGAQAYWRGPHARLGMEEYRAADFIKRYLQNHVLLDYRNRNEEYDYDGCPEYWLTGPEVLTMIRPDAEVMRVIAKDEENFADRSSIVSLLVDEEEAYARSDVAAGWVAT